VVFVGRQHAALAVYFVLNFRSGGDDPPNTDGLGCVHGEVIMARMVGYVNFWCVC
jgi:hypothetical protein